MQAPPFVWRTNGVCGCDERAKYELPPPREPRPGTRLRKTVAKGVLVEDGGKGGRGGRGGAERVQRWMEQREDRGPKGFHLTGHPDDDVDGVYMKDGDSSSWTTLRWTRKTESRLFGR